MEIRYVVGKDNVVADYLSRDIKNELPWSVISCDTIKLSQQLYMNSEYLAFQCQDSELSIIYYLEKNEKAGDLHGIPTDYRRFILCISIQDIFLVFNDRKNIIVIVLQNLCDKVLRYLLCIWSSGQFGIFKTHCHVLESFWRPKLLGHVEAFISMCEICEKTKTSG